MQTTQMGTGSQMTLTTVQRIQLISDTSLTGYRMEYFSHYYDITNTFLLNIETTGISSYFSFTLVELYPGLVTNATSWQLKHNGREARMTELDTSMPAMIIG